MKSAVLSVPETSDAGMDPGARRELEVLNAVAANEHLTQRGLASNLGIALGLVNLYLKRLARKGYIKCLNVQSNRIIYLITPKGIAEKTRLTYEFMQYSLHMYRRVRLHLVSVLTPLVDSDHRRIAIYGRGEAAELAYLSVKEFGLEPVAIFERVGGGTFIGMTVRPIQEQASVSYDLLIAATLASSGPVVEELLRHGVPRAKVLTLRQEEE